MGIFDWFRRPKFTIPAADPPKSPMGPPKPVLHVPSDAELAKHLPTTAAERFKKLVRIYAVTPIEFPHLKEITVAQWGIESAWGSSRAAREEWNFAGMKWRDGDRKYGAEPSKKSGWDGYERVRYSHFPKMEDFIRAYWGRLDEVSAYKGWRKHTQSPITFISSIGPPWVGYHPDEYVENVIKTWKKYTKGLFGE